jgi:hypothetical protein
LIILNWQRQNFNCNITDIQLGKQQEDSQDSQQMDLEVVVAKVVKNKRVSEDCDDSDDNDDSTDSGNVEIMATIKQEKGAYGKTDRNEEPYM